MLDNSSGDNWCQVILLIQQIDPDHRCGLHVVDVHEVYPRGRGGSILDEGNCIAICRPCHRWVDAHPAQATELGLLRATTPDD
jgi:hypothetical protein